MTVAELRAQLAAFPDYYVVTVRDEVLESGASSPLGDLVETELEILGVQAAARCTVVLDVALLPLLDAYRRHARSKQGDHT